MVAGRYEVPAHLSEGAKHLIKRMLTVDPVKRATIAEIRAMPWFQVDLPQYLQPLPEVDSYPVLPMDDLTTLLMINEGQTDPRKVAAAKGLVFTEDLGIIDPEIVAELVEKISSYSERSVWEALQKPEENQIKIAYQLVRDHKRILKGSEWIVPKVG
jgi:carbon catabolite-derepressing protein kinase